MEIRTLRGITKEFSGRTLNPVLEAHLPQYAVEVVAVLQAVRTAARQFPPELTPATVFRLKADEPE